MKPARFVLRMIALAVLAVTAGGVSAAPEEIQVYMDEMNGAGKFGLDVHANYVVSGQGMPDYPGAQAPRHVFRATPEFSWGLSDQWDLGAYILSSVDAAGRSTIDGQKLRLKYIAPKIAGQEWFWGANLEIGRVAHRIDENPWNGELKGILGLRSGRWTLAVNPNFDFKISGPVASPASLGIGSKISWKSDAEVEYGIESYNEMGPFRSLGRLNQQSQTLFGVVDLTYRGWDLNLGIGRGLTTSSDRWLVKAIVGVPFGAGAK
jgi:hypothetical protein